MNDLVEGCKITGDIRLDNEDIYGDMDVNILRKRVGMVFQKANPFPMSIYDNIAFGPRTHGIKCRGCLIHKQNFGFYGKCSCNTKSLLLTARKTESALFESVFKLIPDCGVTQRFFNNPVKFFLALDPISTGKIEELCLKQKNDNTIVMVTHNMQQALRISDETAFFLLGEMVECNSTDAIFSNPQDKRTEEYITGRFG